MTKNTARSMTPKPQALAPVADVGALLRDWLASLSLRTRTAYSQDLADFAAFVGTRDSKLAACTLAASGHAAANMTALRYRTHLAERQLAPATINRRLASLRSAVGMLRMAGVVSWSLEVRPVKALKYRDTRGPGVVGVRGLLLTAGGDSLRDRRDQALIHLLFDVGLRRGEAVSLDIEHVDLGGARLHVQGKGRGGQREALTIPRPAVEALHAYLTARGYPTTGPLFVNVSRSQTRGQRLTGEGVRLALLALARKGGLGHVRPHGLRHAAITAALDAGRDMREVLRFSRHRDPRTLMHYDDSRRDHAGAVAAVVAALVV